MIETKYKTAMVEQKTEYINTCKCDRCGKVSYKHYGKEFELLKRNVRKTTERVSYYHVTTGHNDWGNDSIDSIDHMDICPSCLVNEYSDYVDRASKGYNTEYINIEHESTFSLPFDIDAEGEE